ncbi:MAG: Ig-like domain-containing protein [Verrucomicrobiaceae bacterium]
MISHPQTLLLLTAWIGLTARLLAAPGDLDPTFGSGGIVTASIGTGNDVATSMVVQPDGKIVVAGHTLNGGNYDFALARFNSDGTLDTTFNGTGRVLTDFNNSTDYGRGVALQSDGKIVVVGVSGSAVAVARYNSDGTPDTSFGPAGTGRLVTTGINAGSEGNAVVVQPDGKIVVAGVATGQFGILRYNPDGSLDNGFASGGLATIGFAGFGDAAYCLALQGDGKIIVAGYAGYSGGAHLTGAMRLNADGTLDTSFASSGRLSTGGGAPVYGVTVQGDGKIVLAGGGGDFQVWRLNSNGGFDSSFGGGTGQVYTGVGIAADVGRGVALQSDGRIVVAGYAYNGNTTNDDFAVVRHNTSGSLDTGFQSTGKVTTHIGTNSAYGNSVALQLDGKILVAGQSYNGSKYVFTLARYLAFDNLAVTSPINSTFTNNNQPVISGTSNAGATVNVYVDDVSIGSTVASSAGDWNFTPSTVLVDAVHTVKVLDAADNTFTFSNTTTFTIDTVPPAAPLVSTPANDSVTVNAPPLISGTAEAFSKVTIYLDGVATGTATTSGAGAWSYTPAVALADGSHTVKATATDRAGNTGTFSNTNSFLSSTTASGTPGNLDTSFGTGGKVATGVGSGNDVINGMVVQPDGKIVVVGYAHNGSNYDFALARFNSDGTLDATFNGTGRVLTDFNNSTDYGRGVALQSDGKIVVVGVSGSAVAVARYNSDGTPDTSFGPAGTGRLVTTGINAGSEGNAVVVQPDGKIVVAGVASGQFGVLRYNPDGSLDNGFASGGLATNSFAGFGDAAYCLALQGDGKIVVAGYAGYFGGGHLTGAMRLNADGTLDTSFASSGRLSTGGGAPVYGVAIQADGKIVLAGGGSDFQVWRLNSNGGFDSSFGGGTGQVYTGVGIAADVGRGVALQSDGKIVVAGYAYNGNTTNDDFAVVRYNTNGSLDTGFHSTGKVTTQIGVSSSYGLSVALQLDGKILVAGQSYNGSNYDFTLTRYYGTGQPPITTTGVVSNVTKTAATLTGTANPNSLATSAHFEYGLTSSYGSVTADQACGNGVTAVNLSAGITGLAANTTYHFRLVANNSATFLGGTSYGSDMTFTTAPDPPVAVTAAATTVSASEATLAGVVFPNGRVTTVHFDYGLTTSYTDATSVQTIPAGTNAVNVFAPVTGLVANGTYHFRIVANNSGSPVPIEGLDQTFVAQAPAPSVSSSGAAPLTTTSVRLSGTVRAHNADAQVFFDYGTDGVSFPVSVTATPAAVTGDVDTTVTGTLTNLSQGVTYYYRLRAVSAGGTTMSSVASFTLDVLSGLTQTFPGVAPEAQGFLFVNLTPSGILSGWRFLGELQWRASGVPVGGLTTGDRDIEFRPVPGYIQPPQETVSIISGGAATVLTRDYYVTASSGSGGISVTLKPDALADAGVPQATRAQWRLLGEDDTHWRDSGTAITGLTAGTYSVECKPVSGRATPPLASVIVTNGQTSAPTITYFLADAQSGTAPSGLTFDTVSTDQTKPYAYVGQIRSNVGSSSGFVVKQRVVATAGHVVFDDGTLATAQGLQWLFQRDRGTYEPKPQIPRGYYIFDGYTAQRAAENTPGSSSPQSQTLDVAAMYFLEDAGRGGYGGFLASDNAQNEFLLSSANKLLVGYPVDGIATTSQGRMFATPPMNVTFTAAYGRTFTTADIRSSGGNSGGPLCVQFQNGSYYPAAIYLGGTNQTVVRAIDSAVIDLFNRAETSGNGGANNTGGGITHTSVSVYGSASNPGALKVLIEPAGAVSAGAGWRLSPETSYRVNGAQKSGLNPGTYVLQMKTVSGYDAPASASVTVSGGVLTTVTYSYDLSVVLTPQESWRQTNFGSTSNTGNAADDADPDGDGMNNQAEYTAGTNPNSVGDVFKVQSSTKIGSTFSLSTAGKSGRTYILERSASLGASASWSTVTTQGPLGADAPVTLTDNATPGTNAFYRIRVTGP